MDPPKFKKIYQTLRLLKNVKGLMITRNHSEGVHSKNPCLNVKALNETHTKPATHAIINLDGVVLDSIRPIQDAHDKYLEKWKKALTKNHKIEIMGRRTKEAGELIVKDFLLPIDGPVYANGVWQYHREFFKKHKLKLIKGIEEMICYFKERNIPIALVTSSKAKAFEYKTKRYQELMDMFCHIVLGDDKELKHGLPATDIFEIAASRFSHAPKTMEKFIVIESSVNGIKAAKSAGMQTIFLPDRIIPPELRKADVVLNKLEEFDPKLFSMPPKKK